MGCDWKTFVRTARIFNGFEGPPSDDLWWRTDIDGDELRLLINCNDLFFWGCSDCEELTPENIGGLEVAYKDMLEASPDKKAYNAHLLFCCRERKMRPQPPYYKYFEEWEIPLFDAAGPERDYDKEEKDLLSSIFSKKE